ncbi:MAG: metallophosphoesterase family protein [Alphaproteobacteria bacterium]
MKFRYFTDAHMEDERTSSRPYRYSEQAEHLIRDCIQSCDNDTSHIVFGGDAIQLNKRKGKDHLEKLMRKFGSLAASAQQDFRAVAGNHDFDYFGTLAEVSKLWGIDVRNEYIDIFDGHRLIFINDSFHEKGLENLKPYSQDTIDFVERAVKNAPTKSVTLFSHTPLDHDDWYETKMLMHDGDPEFCFRPNTSEIRDILEQSGKNCLVLSGHSHFEGVSRDKNVIYMTVQSLVEAVRTDPSQIYARWVDITRNGETDIFINQHGYKARDYHFTFDKMSAPQNASAPQAPLLAAE